MKRKVLSYNKGIEGVTGNKAFKIYNPQNSMAVVMEDVFYHLKKQVTLALDFCSRRGTMTPEEREEESFRICNVFFEQIPKVREYVETDLEAAFGGDPAAGCKEEIKGSALKIRNWNTGREARKEKPKKFIRVMNGIT